MKNLFIRFAIVALASVVAIYVAASYSWVRTDPIPISLSKDGNHHFLNERLSADILEWLDQNRSGWNVSLITHVGGCTVGSENFNIRVMDGFLVMNYPGYLGKSSHIQIAKNLSDSDSRFWKLVATSHTNE